MSIVALCNVYALKAAILKEWGTGLDEGALAIGKKYIEQQEMREHYGYRSSTYKRSFVNKFEAETVEDIFRMHLFGVSVKKICQSLMEYQNPLPVVIKQWNAEIIEEILKDEYFTGYKFIFDQDNVITMRVSIAIIPKKMFALTQELMLNGELLSQQERLMRLKELFSINPVR